MRPRGRFQRIAPDACEIHLRRGGGRYGLGEGALPSCSRKCPRWEGFTHADAPRVRGKHSFLGLFVFRLLAWYDRSHLPFLSPCSSRPSRSAYASPGWCPAPRISSRRGRRVGGSDLPGRPVASSGVDSSSQSFQSEFLLLGPGPSEDLLPLPSPLSWISQDAIWVPSFAGVLPDSG